MDASKTSARPAGAAVPITAHAIVALTLLSIGNILNYADRVIISVVGQQIKEEFGLSDTQFSLLTGPFFVAVYVTAAMLFGWLADRTSRRKIIAAIITIWSAMTIASGFARSFAQIAITRAGVGVGEGGSNPAALSLIADHFPIRRRSAAFAIFNATGILGILLAFVVGGYIAQHHGWRTAFFVAGVPGLLLAPVIWFFVKDPKRGQMDGQGQEQPAVPFREAVGMLMRNRPWLWLWIANALATFCNLGILQWLPIVFLRSHDLSVQQVGLFFGPVLTLGMVGGMLLGGWLGDRLTRRSLATTLWLSVGTQFLIVPIYWAALWAPSLPMALACVAVAVAAGVVYSPSITAVLLGVPPAAIRGTTTAFFNLATGLLGQALLPFMAGVLSDHFAKAHGEGDGLRIALSIMIMICWVAGFMFLRGKWLLENRPHTDAPRAAGAGAP